MVSKRKIKKQKNNVGELVKQTENLSSETLTPKQRDLTPIKSNQNTPTNTHERIKTPIQVYSDHPGSYGKINYFWRKWKISILNIVSIVGFLIGVISLFATLSAREEAKNANKEATEANERLQEAIIKIDSMTQMTGTLTMKMAIVSGVIAKGDIILTEEERRALVELVNIIKEKTPSARTAENWATLGYGMLASAKHENWENAIQYFENAINMNAKYAEAYYNLGNIYRTKMLSNQARLNPPIFWTGFGGEDKESNAISNQIRNDFVKAEQYYKTAIKLNQDYQYAYSELGALYYDKGKEYYQNAIVCLREAVRLNSESAYSYTYLGLIYYNQGQFLKSIEQLQMAISINEDSHFKDKAFYCMGIIYNYQDSFPQAINAYREAINITPNYKDAYIALGNTYRKYGHYPEAIENYLQVVNLEPDYTDEPYYHIGISYILQDNYNEAIESFEKIIEYSVFIPEAKTDVFTKMGGFCMKKRNYDIAIKLFQQSLATDSINADTYNSIGACYMGLRDYKIAFDFFQQALTKDPHNVHANQNIMELHMINEELNKIQNTNGQVQIHFLEPYPEKIIK